MNGRRGSRGRQTAAINITPYIDILLVLLIIFMLIHPKLPHNLRTRTSAQAGGGNSAAVVLSVDPEMRMAINRQPVAFPQLGQRLFEVFSSRPDKALFIQGAGELPFGAVARIIDIAKGAGVGDVGLMKLG
jgi:biopolymer transport protein ExbD